MIKDTSMELTELAGMSEQVSALIKTNSVLVADMVRLVESQATTIAALEAKVDEWKQAATSLYFAYTPHGHNSPDECFSKGPCTGDPIQDLIACPGCAAEDRYKTAIAKDTQ